MRAGGPRQYGDLHIASGGQGTRRLSSAAGRRTCIIWMILRMYTYTAYLHHNEVLDEGVKVQVEFSGAATVIAGHESSVLELELASRVLQGVSAIYLLLRASRCPRLEELQAALLRVRGWMGELDDRVFSAPESIRAEMLATTLALGHAVSEISQLLFSHAGTDLMGRTVVASRYISHSAKLIERSRAAHELRKELMSACCAADVQRISESRSR